VKALAIHREGTTADALVGRVLCYDVRDGGGTVVGDKGAVLDLAGAEAVLGAVWEELHVIEVQPGDLHEEDAGSRLAAVVVGDGVEVRAYTGGQWTLAAARRGLLRVRDEALSNVNAQEGISVFTLFDRQPVEAGETVAKAKVTPLVIAGETLAAVESMARAARGVVTVQAFRPAMVGAVAPERLEAKQRQRFETALRQKIDWFGGRLLSLRFGGDTAQRRPAHRRGSERARSARSRLRRARAARGAHGAPRGAGAPGESPVARALARAPRARHADLRHVLAGDDVRPGAPALARRRRGRQP